MGPFDFSINLEPPVSVLGFPFIIAPPTGAISRTGAANETSFPLACPQSNVHSSAYTEDCLSMVLYVPPRLASNSNAPTLMWYVYHLVFKVLMINYPSSRIHGGSFIVGSATAPGIGGSKLAIATGSIVAVVQYRLGAVCRVVLVLL